VFRKNELTLPTLPVEFHWKENLLFDHEEQIGFSQQSETSLRLGQAVSDFYRCPETSLELALDGELSRDPGFFRFGEKITCYGRSRSGGSPSQADSLLYDMRDEVVADRGLLRLPFNPTEIIENLRWERYADGERFWNGSAGLLKRLYYMLRPLMGRSMRSQIQKFRARDLRDLSFPQWPVDTTVENLCETLLLLSMEAKGVERVPFVWFWPEGARGCALMTHDIETELGMKFCGELMDLDDSFGIKACFTIVPEDRYEVSQKFLTGIRKRDFDLGVQDLNHDGRLFDNREEFLRRAAKVNRYAAEYGATGFRAAVLYRRPEWYDQLSFSFDMSIPNVAHLDPQRGGCCTVMPYFIGDMLELPVTTVQDYTLLHILNEYSIDLWKTQMGLIFRKNGMASFIVHPDYVKDAKPRSVYVNLLKYLGNMREEGQIWFALPADVDVWWRARNKMSVERVADSWQIVGEGAERAVLAYAVNRGGQLVYEVPGDRQSLLRASTTPRSMGMTGH
jgi:hypothetical protein